MNQWTPQNIAALITAIAGAITAVGAVIHSMNTRKGVATNEMAKAEAEEPTVRIVPDDKGAGS